MANEATCRRIRASITRQTQALDMAMGCGSAFARVALHFADRDRRHIGYRKSSIAIVLFRTGCWCMRVIIWALMTWVGWGRVECLTVCSLKFWGSRGSRKTSVRAHLLISRPRRPHLRSAYQIPPLSAFYALTTCSSSLLHEQLPPLPIAHPDMSRAVFYTIAPFPLVFCSRPLRVTQRGSLRIQGTLLWVCST